MTLQQQYNLITEGKGNKAHFLKNAKFQFPNLFNNYTSYEDSVNVLKSKGLITEGTNGVGGVVTGGREQDWVKIFKQNISEEVKAEERKTSKEVEDVQAHGFDYKDDKNIDNVYGQAFLHGFYTEMQDPKNEEKTTNEVKAIVAKNLAKDRLYYTKDGMFGIKGIGYTTEAPGLGTPKEPKGKYKSSGYGDLREGMHDKQDSMAAPDTENRFLEPGEEYDPQPIPREKSQALTAADKLRLSTASNMEELKKAIREIILQELSEGAADNEVAKAQQDLLQAKEAAADAELKAAQAAKKEAAAERNA